VGEDTEAVEIGQIELVAFRNPAALTAAGANLYLAPAAAGEPQVAAPGELGNGVLRQGFLESSNVQLADELVTMMLAQRAFELNARVVQAADQMLSITNSLYR
jgi:flagellar basal-body rod protein FlgG